jgi:CRP-like cAMP-binding protein
VTENQQKITSTYQVDTVRLHEIGVVDPYSKRSMELYRSGKLTSDERLYFTLWGSSHLNSSLLADRTRIATAGQPVTTVCVVIEGSLLAIEGESVYRLGPGSVIGLAEGLAQLPYSMTVVTVSKVQVRLFAMHKITALLDRTPNAFKSIMRTTVMRTLGITDTSKVNI